MIRDPVVRQYEKFPYPRVPWLGSPLAEAHLHLSYETGASICQGLSKAHEGKKIALLGCGTVEPLIFGKLQSRAKITAVDSSGRSLSRAQWRCRLSRIRNIKFEENTLEAFCDKNQGAFDYIHSYGVIHHTENPQVALQKICSALRPNGFARIMLYSATARARHDCIVKAAEVLGLTLQQPDAPGLLTSLLKALPETHPLRATFALNRDRLDTSGFIDAYLHARQKSFELAEIQKICTASNLEITAWDLSAQSFTLLQGALGATLLEKIQWLEAWGQWPGHFTFWVRKQNHNTGLNPADEKPSTRLIMHPLLSKKLPLAIWPSSLLRTTLKLTPEEEALLGRIKAGEKVTLDDPAGFRLCAARILLEVQQ